MVRLFPVIESAHSMAPFWIPLPAKPWPAFIELGAESSDADLTMVSLTLASYGRTAKGVAESLRALALDFPAVAPGGLAVSDGTVEIFPSCCCGLEDWRSWCGLLDDSGNPWLGHDPAPWVEVDGQSFTVWADGGLTELDRSKTPKLTMDRSALEEQLAAVESALRALASRLQEFLAPYGLEDAKTVTERFYSTFIDRKIPEAN